MKKPAISLVSVSLFVLMITTLTGIQLAQAQSKKLLRANIPFQFELNGKTQAAGTYEVLQVGANQFAIRDKATSMTVMLGSASSVINLLPAESGKLVFHKYGNRMFLAQIWRPEESLGVQLTSTRGEKDAAKNAEKKQLVAVSLQR